MHAQEGKSEVEKKVSGLERESGTIAFREGKGGERKWKGGVCRRGESW